MLQRRGFLSATLGAAVGAACNETPRAESPPPELVAAVTPLGFPWETSDPFLFCAHHDDAYPAGNAALGPAASLEGRRLGSDFAGRDGWRMYHGERVPGFPQHPHRGFETVSVVTRGLVNHADSLGATARYGEGDVQWMTAGSGIVHAEMFPLLDDADANPLEMFQVWLNLPAADKLVEPHFRMLWNSAIPRHAALDASGRKTMVTVVAGRLGALAGPEPPPHSWAARPTNDVAIWTLAMDPGAAFTLPAAQAGSVRTLYFYRGGAVQIGGRSIGAHSMVKVARAELPLPIVAGGDATHLVLLQGRPIGEPIARHGPFVMNTEAEIEKAYADYRATRFGGWPWPAPDPVHDRWAGRFARHVDGRYEKAG